MAFICPYCREAPLTTVGRLHCSSREHGTDVLQFLFCDHCGLHVLGLDCREPADAALHVQLGYIVEKRVWIELHLTWACCPDPHNADCHCPAHQDRKSVVEGKFVVIGGGRVI